MNKFRFLKAFWSPFKRPRILIHIGGLKIGTPYFLPSKWIGLKFVGLGWKTKWSDTDYRHEWSPTWSFHLFRFQIAIIFNADSQYWESWLYYERNTDKSLSVEDRVKIMKTKFPQTWKNRDGEIDYYPLFLKKKYV